MGTAVGPRTLVAIHDRIVEIVNDLSAVAPQVPGVNGVELLFMQKDAVEIGGTSKQPMARYWSSWQRSYLTSDPRCRKRLEVDPYALPETRSLGVVRYDEKSHFEDRNLPESLAGRLTSLPPD